ncbi:hypothetical protein JR316_0009636 [Psilocybe cubensis]|uniref:Uncharacterized protein n=1 Tax=Psilocybe cubensis TaxID=181762 RepID=A0ACB8GNY0_PSICU|nr:hypothetical protein JR316_0009636 [Psilocybe cubensis]KAH9477423.1 hypothetical protein JR316_0009636 [Psilocybe cubensis]
MTRRLANTTIAPLFLMWEPAASNCVKYIKMITWDLRRRFTASEALQFFEQSLSEMSQKELETPHPTMLRPDATYLNYDRWAGLPLDLKEKWKMHKTPPIPWHLMFLRVKKLINLTLEQKPHADLRITFSMEPDADRVAQREFWSSSTTLEWFKHRGYELYRSIDGTDKVYPIHPPEFPEGSEFPFYLADYPYASFKTVKSNDMHLLEEYNIRFYIKGNIAYAQDVQNRHVVIKIVPKHTEEYRILRFLHAQKLDTLKENGILPVLDLLPTEGYYFADIGKHNVLTNHFYCLNDMGYLERYSMRSRGILLYAVIDFDASVMLPADVDRSKFRLPYEKGFRRYPTIKDMQTGPFDYNPFVQDVGAMGAMLCLNFQHLSLHLPLLAPLFDGMTTWELDKRFTASEALQFFNDRVSEIVEEQLGECPQSENDSQLYYYDDYDRWKTLSPDFVEKWKVYKARKHVADFEVNSSSIATQGTRMRRPTAPSCVVPC